jgi:hypothetical protein
MNEKWGGELEQERTIYFVIFLHKEERVKVHVTVELHPWPGVGTYQIGQEIKK